MPTQRNATLVFLAAIVLSGWSAPELWAQQPAPSPALTSGSDRLFLAFAEDSAIIETQWWEGQLAFSDGPPIDTTALLLQAALQPTRNLELGGRVGFGDTDAGSGATDLDFWGKWGLGTAGADTEFAVGGLATIPTGDDTAGLGRDSFDFEVFGSLRHRLENAVISGHLGYRFNGDGTIGGASFNGKNSVLLGAGLIVPMSDVVSLVGELNMETERIENGDSDLRALAGVNWRAFNRGILRGAVAVGLTDGAPDAQVLAGYAYTF